MSNVRVANQAVQVEKSGPRSPAMDKTTKETSQTVALPFESVLTVTRERGKRKSGDAPPAEGETHAPPEIDTKGWLS